MNRDKHESQLGEGIVEKFGLECNVKQLRVWFCTTDGHSFGWI